VGERIAIHAKQAVKASILYESKCDKCKPDKTGNSSMSDAEGFQEGSHIVKHWMQKHADDDVKPHFIFTACPGRWRKP
jgi:hypothetical protein